MYLSNLEYELRAIDIFLRSYDSIALDTEFPSFLRNTPHNTVDSKRYNDLKYNVDTFNPVQLGFTLFKENGAIGNTWQVHFCNFDTNADTNNPSVSISLTKRKSGINFERQRQEGVNLRVCVEATKYTGQALVSEHLVGHVPRALRFSLHSKDHDRASIA
ncbi:hypothetical protein LguiA_013189 [Lonicera macranthoides]